MLFGGDEVLDYFEKLAGTLIFAFLVLFYGERQKGFAEELVHASSSLRGFLRWFFSVISSILFT